MNAEVLHQELKFKTSRSSGSGGQHVNKVETRVELRFDVAGSGILNEYQKALISRHLANRINKDGYLIISSEDSRSQLRNRQIAIFKFDQLITEALRPRKKRRGAGPLQANREKRLQEKRRRSEKKALRGKIMPS